MATPFLLGFTESKNLAIAAIMLKLFITLLFVVIPKKVDREMRKSGNTGLIILKLNSLWYLAIEMLTYLLKSERHKQFCLSNLSK